MLLALILIVATVLPMGMAWLSDKRARVPNLNSGVQGSYFESGDGTKEIVTDANGNIVSGPFEIKYPIQLYYFAWLQALGVFNHEYDDNPGTLQQYYFRVSDDLDMKDITLPPVGTQTFPFVGNFDGENHIISNLTVTNQNNAYYDKPTYDSSTETEVANGAQIVGFFGVIGTTGAQVDDTVNGSGEVTANGSVTIGGTTYTYSSTVNEVKNFLLDNVTIKTEAPADNKTLVGLAAGYVNGGMSSVGVYGGSIEVASGLSILDESVTDKISCYSLVGYSKVAVDAYVAKEGGSGNDWGGSIAMKDAHTRLATQYNATNATTNYMNSLRRNVFLNEDNTPNGDPVVTSREHLTTSGGTSINKYRYVDLNSSGGKILLADGDTTQYLYVSGGIRLTDTVYYYADTTGYTVSDAGGTYYLQGAAGSVTHSTASGTAWIKDGDAYYIETVSGQATSSTKYYLGADAYGRVTCTTTPTDWTLSGSSLYTVNQYLVHVNGANGGWGLTDNRAIVKISDGTNYLGSSGTAAVTAGNAAEWLHTDGYLHTVVNNTHYYLNRNGNTVSITTTPTTQWSVSASGVTDGNYSLVCDGGTWKAEQTGIYISDGTNYLSIVNNAIGNRTSTANATAWSLTANGTGYRIHATVGNTTYYLRNNNGTLELYSGNTANNRTTWTMGADTLVSDGYQIGYDNGWKLGQAGYYLYGGGCYINHGNTYRITVGTNQNSATVWILNDEGSFSPSDDTTRRIAYYNGSNTLIAGQNNQGDKFYSLTNDGYLNYENYYIRYNNNAWTTTTNKNRATSISVISAFNSDPLQFVSTGTPLSNEDQSFTGIAWDTSAAKYYTSRQEEPYMDYDYDDGTTVSRVTYFPLTTEDNSTLARNSNTGYIVGGSATGWGDIRISYYAISGNISNSYRNSELDTSRIYTINNDGEQTIASIGVDNLKKYKTSAPDFLSILKNQSNVYGLHFMNTQISIDNLVTASTVTINGDTYTNYQMPASSIDFNLKERGYINFFAGTYYSQGNTAFFSLHRIFRDNTQKITAIKEIEEIWGVEDDENLLYAYVYSDGTVALSDGSKTFASTSALPTGYTCLFKTAWIKVNNNLKQKYIYYFEVPADSGEYALGSVDGGLGAYLMYLDISANNGDMDRSIMDYLKGVDFVTSNDAATAEAMLTAIADNNPTAAFAIKDLFSGNVSNVSFARTEAGDTITFTVTGNVAPADYMRKYYIPQDGKTIVINFVPNS